MMCLRARLIDKFVESFLEKSNDSVAIHLGCGLDSRCNRINNNADWYDVDFKEVIDLRKNFYEETERYHLISSSVTEDEWLREIPKGKTQYIVIAEGLFMYLNENDIKSLIKNLKDTIGSFTLILDVFSAFAAKKMKNHPSIKKTGATIQWGIDDPDELANWGMGIHLIKEEYFTSNEVIDKFGTSMKVIFKLANLFPIAKNAQRILSYRIEI